MLLLVINGVKELRGTYRVSYGKMQLLFQKSYGLNVYLNVTAIHFDFANYYSTIYFSAYRENFLKQYNLTKQIQVQSQ